MFFAYFFLAGEYSTSCSLLLLLFFLFFIVSLSFFFFFLGGGGGGRGRVRYFVFLLLFFLLGSDSPASPGRKGESFEGPSDFVSGRPIPQESGLEWGPSPFLCKRQGQPKPSRGLQNAATSEFSDPPNFAATTPLQKVNDFGGGGGGSGKRLDFNPKVQV